MGSWAERTHSKAAAGGPRQAWLRLADPVRRWIGDWVVPHSHADKLAGTTGEQDRPRNLGF